MRESIYCFALGSDQNARAALNCFLAKKDIITCLGNDWAGFGQFAYNFRGYVPIARYVI